MKSKLPFYKQETRYSCVPACLRMVLASLGLDLSETELRTGCDCTPFGTDALNAVDAARRLGFPKTAKYTLSLDELESLIASGHYPIVFVNLGPIDGLDDEHALVVTEVSHTSISVHDPLQGERILPHDTFSAAWAMMHRLVILIER